MAAVGAAPGQLRAHDGHDGGQGVGGVVHAVQNDGDGMGHESHGQLECHEQQIARNAVYARPNDLPLAIHNHHLRYIMCALPAQLRL